MVTEEISALSLFLGSSAGHPLLLILTPSSVDILSFLTLSLAPISKLSLAPAVLRNKGEKKA